MSAPIYPTTNPVLRHHSMKITGIYALGVMILSLCSSGTLAANPLVDQGGMAPKLLAPSASKTTVPLSLLLQKALDNHVSLKLIKNQRDQKHSEKWLSIGAMLPKLKLSSNYTRNIPEVESQLFDVSSQANLNRQVASLLRKSGESAEAETLDRSADLMMRRGAGKGIVINPKHVVDGRLSLEIPLFHGGSLAKTMASHENVVLHDAKIAEEQAKTLYAAARAYFAATYSQNVLMVRKQAESFALELFKKASDQRKSGLIMRKDFLAAEANSLEKQGDYKQAVLDNRSALGELGIMAGITEEFLVSEPDPIIFTALNADLERLLAIALVNRPDLQVSLIAHKITERERLGHFLQFLPAFLLRGDANYTSNDKGMIGESFTYAVSINASMALFDGGTSLFALRQSSLKQQENEIKTRELKVGIEASLRGRKEKLAVMEFKEQASKSKRDAAIEAAQVAYDRYSRALIESDKFFEIEDKKITAELMYKKSQSDVLLEKLALTYEAGLLTPQWAQ